MEKMKFKGAIFDMDGTLIDSLIFWDYYWRELGKKYKGDENFRPSPEDDRAVRTMVTKEASAFIKEKYNFTQSVDELYTFVMDLIKHFYRDIVKEKLGATPLLKYLKDKGVKICLATATDMENVVIAIKSCGLEEYFDVVLSCADIGKGKDQPDIYINAIKELNMTKDDVCIFEDSFVALETAKKLGVQTVGIFDINNYGQDRLKNASDFYLGEGLPLTEIINHIEV